MSKRDRTHYVGDDCPGGHRDEVASNCTRCGCPLGLRWQGHVCTCPCHWKDPRDATSEGQCDSHAKAMSKPTLEELLRDWQCDQVESTGGVEIGSGENSLFINACARHIISSVSFDIQIFILYTPAPEKEGSYQP